MTSQLPQVQTLTSLGTFLRLTQDSGNVLQGLTREGATLPTPVSRIKASVHVTNLGRKPVKLTLRSLAGTTKVGASQIQTVVPQQLITFTFDDWFDNVEFLAEGVAGNDGVTSVMVRGSASVPFSFFSHPPAPRTGTISTGTAPFDYPQGVAGSTIDPETGIVTFPTGNFIYTNAPLSSSSSGP